VQCRGFVYEGAEYEEPPKAMIMEGILQNIFAKPAPGPQTAYALPDNLEAFFAGRQAACCDSSGCSGKYCG
jgi:hypothetical protein